VFEIDNSIGKLRVNILFLQLLNKPEFLIEILGNRPNSTDICYLYLKLKPTRFIKDLKPVIESMRFYTIAALLLIAFLPAPAQTDTDVEVGVIEKLDQYIPLDAKLINENGDTVLIGDLLDKPTILNFVYYRCPGICSPLMDGLADAMDGNDLVLGEDYQALTISFDAREAHLPGGP
jgi:hypothetical protein